MTVLLCPSPASNNWLLLGPSLPGCALRTHRTQENLFQRLIPRKPRRIKQIREGGAPPSGLYSSVGGTPAQSPRGKVRCVRLALRHGTDGADPTRHTRRQVRGTPGRSPQGGLGWGYRVEVEEGAGRRAQGERGSPGKRAVHAPRIHPNTARDLFWDAVQKTWSGDDAPPHGVRRRRRKEGGGKGKH